MALANLRTFYIPLSMSRLNMTESTPEMNDLRMLPVRLVNECDDFMLIPLIYSTLLTDTSLLTQS